MKLHIPNASQANKGSMPGQVRSALDRWLRDDVDGMLPGVVISYDDRTNRATIQPLVMMGTTDGSKVPRARIDNIPVFRFGGGGLFMRFPLKPGDVGWLAANDRDISLVMQAGGGEDWPNTKRAHSFSDAMFFPDTFKDWVIGEGNADAAVWQTLDGNTCIAMSTDRLQLTQGELDISMGGGAVAITSPLLTHNGVNIGASHVHTGSPTAPNGPVSSTGAPVP